MRLNKYYITPLLSLTLMVLSVGCDKSCKYTVQDFAIIQNRTNRSLTLNLCKGRTYGEIQASVEANEISQEIALGSREETHVQGGMNTQSCSAPASRMEMGISLAPASFDQVKFCYDEASKLNVIVETYQDCPSGFLEQSSPAPCQTF